MRVGDLVQHKEKFIATGGVQKQGLVLKIERRLYNSQSELCVLGTWGHPAVGLRWIPVKWLEVIS